ncbi:hypothetical protein LY76DRAFT_623822 [Colletotrichum caudatum]|nr:hypothetical protein LY76DRAFT_623822 [Colletotrichum caudatum]
MAVSDFHLEVPKAYNLFKSTPQAPYLGLLGDIGNVAAHKGDFLSFLRQQLRQFRAVQFIDDWEVGVRNEAHTRDLAWLNSQVTEIDHSDVDIIIFSHWSPSRDGRAIDPRHANVKIWAFGHTQYNCDFTVERESHAEPLTSFKSP